MDHVDCCYFPVLTSDHQSTCSIRIYSSQSFDEWRTANQYHISPTYFGGIRRTCTAKVVLAGFGAELNIFHNPALFPPSSYCKTLLTILACF